MKKNINHSYSKKICGALLCLALASCTGSAKTSFDVLEQSFKPQLERITVSMFVNVSAGTNLDYQMAYLASVMDGLGRTNKLYFRLTSLPGGAYVDEMKKSISLIKRALKKRGARASHIKETEHGRPVGHLLNAPVDVGEGSSVLVAVDSYRIIPPECNNMEESFIAGRETHGMKESIGCTNATNRTLMAASPLDLFRGRDLATPDAAIMGQTAAGIIAQPPRPRGDTAPSPPSYSGEQGRQ